MDHHHDIFFSPKSSRSLSSIPSLLLGKNDWKHAYIFCTFLKCREKVCQIIIDKGSSINAVSKSGVLRMRLQPEPHLHPYKIDWVNETSLIVLERRLVPIKMGDYFDKIWCDVLPTEVAHIVLGHPWICDLSVTHCYRESTYSFQYNGKNIKLNPAKPFEKDSKAQYRPSPQPWVDELMLTRKMSKGIFQVPSKNVFKCQPPKSNVPHQPILDNHVEEVSIHDTHTSIVSDRDVKYKSQFWKILWASLDTSLKFSFAFCPQIDTKNEVVNRALGKLVNYLVRAPLNNSYFLLSAMEFAYNSLANWCADNLLFWDYIWDFPSPTH
ncbi:uncharacterized protein LOC132269582 [Cornus florida]|uniref:uncharacterized protein LOC132269582 n=1 Tax=Cornus florida TaxID=4283 RepID=UPI0028987228|nr:uncharacterized protein LOC132269582 [Cornus florida]